MTPPAKIDLDRDQASREPARPLTADGDPPAPSAAAHDAVEVYGDDSFPASDPPAWWAGP